MSFDHQSVRRISRAVREHERTFRRRAQDQENPPWMFPRLDTQPIRHGKAKTAIPAGGSGNVLLDPGSEAGSEFDTDFDSDFGGAGVAGMPEQLLIGVKNLPIARQIEQDEEVLVSKVAYPGANSPVFYVLPIGQGDGGGGTVSAVDRIVARISSSAQYFMPEADDGDGLGIVVNLSTFQQSGADIFSFDGVNDWLECEIAGEYWISFSSQVGLEEVTGGPVGNWGGVAVVFPHIFDDTTATWGGGLVNGTSTPLKAPETADDIFGANILDSRHVIGFPFRVAFDVGDRIRMRCVTGAVEDLTTSMAVSGGVTLNYWLNDLALVIERLG